jgi:hypothetical protein
MSWIALRSEWKSVLPLVLADPMHVTWVTVVRMHPLTIPKAKTEMRGAIKTLIALVPPAQLSVTMPE